MPTVEIDGTQLAYEVIGDAGEPWVITPGGRFSKDVPGIRQLAEALAASGNRVVIWDRPNCGASDVCFTGDRRSRRCRPTTSPGCCARSTSARR